MNVYNPPAGAPVTPYVSDALNGFLPILTGTNVTSFTVATDWIVPFTVRETVTVDGVWWRRANTTAANVYVGIYDVDGVLLTDCAVDADTTAGYHVVSTAPVILVPNRVYYGAINQSVLVCVRNDPSTASDLLTTMGQFAQRPAMMAAVSATWSDQPLSKARATAALLSNLVMTGWNGASLYMAGGFVKQ